MRCMRDIGVNGDVSWLSTCVQITETHFKIKCKKPHRVQILTFLINGKKLHGATFFYHIVDFKDR